jgi:tetratricopeptide (TPR) repeat protein
MTLFKQSFLATMLVVGAPFTCAAQDSVSPVASPLPPQQDPLVPLQEHIQKISKAFAEAADMRQADPRRALALLEEVLEMEPPPFDKSNPGPANMSYRLYRGLASLYFDAAVTAYQGGYWEKSADYYKKSAETINGAVDMTKEAFTQFIQYHKQENERLQMILDTNADDIKSLRAKDEKSHTEDERESMRKLASWEKEIEEHKAAVDYFANSIKTAEGDAAAYNTTPSREEQIMGFIRQQQDSIDAYTAGPGDKNKWVEGIVANYATFMQNFSNDEKIAYTYRLTVLSPESTTVPVLLDFLQGKATEADFKRAVQAAAPARRPPARPPRR